LAERGLARLRHPGSPRADPDDRSRPGRPKVIQTARVFVDAAGLVYITDYNAGLSIIEFGG